MLIHVSIETTDPLAGTSDSHRRTASSTGHQLPPQVNHTPADEVEISVVDPRNMIWLVPAIWRDARNRGMSPGTVWEQVHQGVAQDAIIVDGKVVLTGTVAHPDEALAAVRADLAPVA